ncbi:hypothetical protein GI374_10190 [Paracoccus sp. S-4012]|uniref:sulfotransferase family 2 domain-containing protein n=1 Tax=Paracoccus sp. S-4012 TaxID=2665648 RepID=UPI0012B01FBF|nr:sulfotransferase family 2 domain-containing protein [Paracoccus sp. S-4012]MRX50808.1 hypothetical protein [Paracoccus sp. S-4012]
MTSKRIRAMIAAVGSPRELNYTTHVSPELGFIYFATPIVACSTIKATLNLAVARRLGLAVPGADFRTIHNRDANPLKRPRDIGMDRFEAMLADPAVVKFALVRDPADRLVSAFAKKLRGQGPFVRKLLAHLGLPPQGPSPFATPDDFAAALAADPALLMLDEHWRPQRRQVFFDHIPDLRVVLLDDLEAELPNLLDPIFGGGRWHLVDSVALKPGNSAANRRPATLTEAGREAVAQAYTEDVAMLSEVRDRQTAPAPVPAAKPRAADGTRPQLILHIGMGKTGTSAVQAALAEGGAALAAQGAAYLGMWFALPGEDRAGWEDNAAFLRQPLEALARFGAAWRDALLARVRSEGLQSLVLSNESLVGAPAALQALLGPVREAFDVRAICYARDPFAWLPSAYAQWGLRDRHKGGEPDDYATGARRVVRHYRGVVEWAERMPELLELRPYDGVTDIVADFAAAAGLELPPLTDRVWPSPEPAELIARARYSAGFPERIEADRFDRRVLAEGRAVPSIEALAARHLDTSATAAIVAENAAIFDRIARDCGLELRGAAGPRSGAPDRAALRDRLLDYLLELTLDQARRIEALEARLAGG